MSSALPTLPALWSWRATPQPSGTLVDRVAQARGIALQDLPAFVNPDFYDFWHNPLLLSGMAAAVERLVVAHTKQEKILIFGDYDADGVPATALMIRCLKNLGYQQLDAIIPTRRDGYGLNDQLVAEIIRRASNLVVTVDTGSSAAAAVRSLQTAGIEVIITDHHEIPEGAPAAILINPKQTSSKYPNRDLSGTGVAYKLLWQLYEALGKDPAYLKMNLDLVALATAADVMPMVGENRSLIIYGMKVLQKTVNHGLRALLLTGEIAPSEATYRHLSFLLAPRLNALSRLGLDETEVHSKWGSLALALLLAESPTEAMPLAQRLHEINNSRRELISGYYDSILESFPIKPTEAVILYLPDIPVGLLGLIAGNLLEQLGVPVLLMSLDADGAVRGSGRSLAQYPSLPAVLGSLDGLLERFGGHQEAAGWSLQAKNVDAFITAVRDRLVPDSEPVRGALVVDTYIQADEVTLDQAQALASLAPFGQGNPEPLLYLTGVVQRAVPVGREAAHARLVLRENPDVDIMWFRHKRSTLPAVGSEIQAAVRLGINTWRDPKPELIIEEIIYG